MGNAYLIPHQGSTTPNTCALSWREHRLLKVYCWALGRLGLSFEAGMLLIKDLWDADGVLSVRWKASPTKRMRDAFKEAWGNACESQVEHVCDPE
jgi:hypothetical protein